MRNILLIIALLLAFSCSSAAQFKIGQDIIGTPYDSKYTDGYVGDVYLYSNWITGHVLQENEKYFNNMLLKYDIFNDRIIFKSNEDQAMAFKYPIKEFQMILNKSSIEPMALFKNGFPEVGKYNQKSYYQVLTEGKTTLLKKLYKSISESISYGESEKKKTFLYNEIYFLCHQGKMIKFQKNTKNLLAILSDKRTKLSNFIKEKNLIMKSEEDYVNVINYYNTL
ncbi:hypothetical protein OQZ33_00535 [Pedobacter sp. MC2016-05]|uniref:hypothetical protein n=1 Tax=Pedobacter sp. MC2016-05 TaxID=2994474 RepID=UPI002245B9BF|nr:hypothetical protein [Pedobacter sp. MC2016-05]MCX2472804.1 hypothetical protein [Pedobacter sp. MC2016-05]